jgi:hypothetical protein
MCIQDLVDLVSSRSHWSFEYTYTCINIWHFFLFIWRCYELVIEMWFSSFFCQSWSFFSLVYILCSHFVFMPFSSFSLCLASIKSPVNYNLFLLCKNYPGKRNKNITICKVNFLINNWTKLLNFSNHTWFNVIGHFEPILWFLWT